MNVATASVNIVHDAHTSYAMYHVCKFGMIAAYQPKSNHHKQTAIMTTATTTAAPKIDKQIMTKSSKLFAIN